MKCTIQCLGLTSTFQVVSSHKSYAVSGYHIGQCGYRPFPSLQNVLGSIALQGVTLIGKSLGPGGRQSVAVPCMSARLCLELRLGVIIKDLGTLREKQPKGTPSPWTGPMASMTKGLSQDSATLSIYKSLCGRRKSTEGEERSGEGDFRPRVAFCQLCAFSKWPTLRRPLGNSPVS